MTFKPVFGVFRPNTCIWKKMGNQNFEISIFWPFFPKNSTTLLFEEQQASPIFQILISSLFNILMKKNYRKKCLMPLESTL